MKKSPDAIDLSDCPPALDSEEMTCLRAMQHPTYTMIAVIRIEPGVGCHVRDMFTEETHLLVDMGLAKTGCVGFVLATRLLNFGDFVTTSGASLPMGVLDDDQLNDMQQTFRGGVADDGFDPASLIRGFLEHGAASRIQYEGGGSSSRIDVGGTSRFAKAPVRRLQTSRKRQATKAVTKRRCSCGSGKMFKNCCGKN